MQTIQIEIKDNYLPNILEILNGLKNATLFQQESCIVQKVSLIDGLKQTF